MNGPTDADDLTLFAHRGFAGENPENTVAAVEAAAGAADSTVRRRTDRIEIDVVPTADGDVVVLHDVDLAARTDAAGIVWETDTETVTGAEVLDSGETVPLLADVLDAVPTDIGVNVELKNPGQWDLRPGEKLDGGALAERTAVWRPFVERVLTVTDDTDHDLLFSSFCEGALAAVRALSTHRVAPLLSGSIEDGLAMARAHDAAAVHPPIDMVRGTPFFDASRFGDDPPHADAGLPVPDDATLVSVAHAEGRDVNVWTVETWYQADRLAAVGVDGVIADYSALL
ncbi:MAG: glycerophosphodiester phosphodiesterase [Halorubrum sp.]